MSIQFTNTLTKQKEAFVPLEPGKVKMYVCGPTVYNYIHIGNARPAIVFDTLRRYLKYRGYEVTFVQNITDVDDKLIRKANEEGITVKEVADRYTDAFNEDLRSLNILPPDIQPRVMQTIPEIIQFIEGLIEKGYAYDSEGDVYFRTGRFTEYGKLSHQPLDELQAGARVEINEKKENPLDFALWKAAKPGEVSWSSPWGEGRPGWHIECSAMALKFLGDQIDIHAGGADLVFPHHENEIAQSECYTGKVFARYWLHNGMLNINNEKMSKSLGNFILARDLIQHYGGELIRFFMLQGHYRNPINFSDDLLEQAANGLERIKTAYANLRHRLETARPQEPNGLAEEQARTISQLREQFIAEMDDDLNTANAITVVYEVVKEANLYLRNQNVGREQVEQYLSLLTELTSVLGVQLEQAEELLDSEVEALIGERTEARRLRNFARADEIRDLLSEKGIVLEDTPQGVRWRRK
ncbi:MULTISPECIES: cysteine--tRNA ligase [Brevibacillus]|jgi:cysteinyl-tRNA synthetase|uniref:cysteine--tRNA ligase n=1 Tax=Brevibacillus TaxID=55080 RepID=UPI0004687C73|nr:cysteine--tRNA ligase [Brevibacillus borstelensis]MCM3560278.1 cysteine--tRNA ligase [Brevibacillus borstelensis]MCM3592393.1 cysteine--tRNA ligase [Brevibacillus borstelensis]MCM3624696.1 cysteine--tRNA ligase [Brevibacillus borstelensis]MED1854349.1 cysteine--tRNA ligase [Brevibacillus borstelensis]MED1883393.1 cysteine--tRNA ligase [Brevibacillus borstelensis]